MSTYRIFDGYTMSFQDMPSHEFPCMKSTELRDLEGAIIYECDVLVRGDQKGIVEWDEWARRFVLRGGKVTRTLDNASDWSVAGNAFQNGDLL